MSTCEINLNLHRKQSIAFTSPANEILYGGAAGGGKSHLMRSVAIALSGQIPGLQTYIFRRIKDDLVKNHVEGPNGFRALLAPLVYHKAITIVEDEIRFSNGSKVYLCHCKDEKDIYKYQGSEIHVLLIDELTHFTEKMYRFLRSRVRSPGLNIPTKLKQKLPLILCGSNPGNIGHLWVKKTFVDYAPPYQVIKTADQEGGMLRQFIPARLEDNPSMTMDDPAYEQRLMGLGSEKLVRAMRFGDWSVIEGAFFGEFNPDVHVIKPFEVPNHWTRFMAIDWGSAEPCAIGWFAIVPDEFGTPDPYVIGGDRSQFRYQGNLPKGALVMYRERYFSEDHNNVGLKMTAEAVAERIVDAELNEPRKYNGASQIAYRVCDTKLLAHDGGPSISERMGRTPYNLYFQMADTKRIARYGAIGGWDQVRSRLVGHDDFPQLYFMNHCIDTIRTLPAMQHDPDKPEDMISDGVEDHLSDAVRYACMSRPYSRPIHTVPNHDNLKGTNHSQILINTNSIDLFQEDYYSRKRRRMG
jgi:hypothetical protein